MKKFLFYALVSVLALAAILSLLGYLGQISWIFDLFSHFKWQYLLTLSIGTLILAFLKNKLAFLFLPFIVLLAIEIGPLYYGGNKAENLKGSIKIVSINLLSTNRQFHKVVNYISDKSPDIIALQEFTDLWETKLEPELKDYKYRLMILREDNFGMAIYSKIKLLDVKELKIANAPGPVLQGHFFLEDTKINLIVTHPFAPVGSDRFRKRNAQLAVIGELVAEMENEVILIGDLNTSSFSPHFKSMMKKSGLIDSRKGFGLRTTWPSSFGLVQTTLDHFLVSQGISIKSREAGEDVGSDHLPIFIELGVQ